MIEYINGEHKLLHRVLIASGYRFLTEYQPCPSINEKVRDFVYVGDCIIFFDKHDKKIQARYRNSRMHEFNGLSFNEITEVYKQKMLNNCPSDWKEIRNNLEKEENLSLWFNENYGTTNYSLLIDDTLIVLQDDKPRNDARDPFLYLNIPAKWKLEDLKQVISLAINADYIW